jgi:hypothetical protein
MNRKIFAFLIVGLTPLANVAPAQVITINPNNFANGQVINAPGVTLETETFVSAGTDSNGNPQYVPTFYGPVYSAVIAAGCGPQCPPIGNSVFAPSSSGGLPLPNNDNAGPGGWWGVEGDFGANINCSQNCLVNSALQGAIVLRLDFAQPTDYVNVLAFFNGGDPTEMLAFDAVGNPIGGSENGEDTTAGGWGDLNVTTATDDISTVLIAGDRSFRAINEIQYGSAPTQAPEIDPTSAASGLTLLLGGLLVLRGRRPMKLDSAAA